MYIEKTLIPQLQKLCETQGFEFDDQFGDYFIHFDNDFSLEIVINEMLNNLTLKILDFDANLINKKKYKDFFSLSFPALDAELLMEEIKKFINSNERLIYACI